MDFEIDKKGAEMTSDEKRKSLVTLTFVIVILFLGLRLDREENNYHFFRVKNEALNLYAIPIGTRQVSYADGFTGPICEQEWGLTNLSTIVQYKYYFIVTVLLFGILSVMTVRGRPGDTPK